MADTWDSDYNGNAESSAAHGLANDAITEIALCEVPHILLRPGQLYLFVVRPGCKACEDAAAPYSPNKQVSGGQIS